MIRKIEILNYGVLRYVSQTLDPFQVLIGPNASGKSTLLDAIELLADMVGLPDYSQAITNRTSDFSALTWMRQTDWFEIAVEVEIPQQRRRSDSRYPFARYELRVGLDEGGKLSVSDEALWLMERHSGDQANLPTSFPFVTAIPERITRGSGSHTPKTWRKVIRKTSTGNDYFQSETTGWNIQFRSSGQRLALANVPDEERLATAVWLRQYLAEHVQRIVLNSEAMRVPSPPGTPISFQPDGSNLPQVIHVLEAAYPHDLEAWIEHVRTALPDVKRIFTTERPEDKNRYLNIEYASGLIAPSWVVSDGTLRILALTILAYYPPSNANYYLIEEPENGIHPLAVETVIKSLQSVYGGGVLLATHSPVVLSIIEPDQLLCFAKTDDGMASIVRGDIHPSLVDWQGEVSLETLFGAGVLG